MKRFLMFFSCFCIVLQLSSCGSKKSYVVNFDTKGGTTIESVNVLEGDKISKPSDPILNGYTFNYWAFNNKIWSFENDIVNQDINLEANFTPTVYNVKYILNGGINNKENPTSYTILDSFCLKDPIKEGFTFNGWTNENNQEVTQILKGTTEELVFYANWSVNQYNLTFIDGFGNTLKTTTLDYGEQIEYPEDPVNEYYTFVGWDCKLKKMPEKNLVIKAEWTSFDFEFSSNSLTRYCGTQSDVVIPTYTPTGEIVKYIQDSAFKGCKTITSLFIPNSILIIGRAAFWGCSSLLSVNINFGVEQILDSAFWECTSLMSLIIPNSVNFIGKSAFSFCDSLISISLSENITSIQEAVFNSCLSLKSIIIPNKVELIDYWAFHNCSSLVYVILPKSVVTIKTDAFDFSPFKPCHIFFYCENKNKQPGWYGFSEHDFENFFIWDCGTMKIADDYIYSIKDVDGVRSATIVRYIGEKKVVTIPEVIDEIPVLNIGEAAFYNLQIDYLIIPNSVIWIGKRAFTFCSFIIAFIPKSVLYIGKNAFYDCPHASVYFEGGPKTPPEWDDDWFNGLTLNCNSGKIAIFNSLVYKIQNNQITLMDYFGSENNVDIPECINNIPVTSIGDRCFANNTFLINISIPNSVVSIGYQAFFDCLSISSIEIPKKVESIGEEAFYNCPFKHSLVIPYSVKKIGRHAFYLNSYFTFYCEAQSKPAYWDSWYEEKKYHDVQIVWNSSGCGSNENFNYVIQYNYGNNTITITDINQRPTAIIPESINGIPVTRIDRHALINKFLQSITLPSSFTEIADYNFLNCEYLTSINIPENVTSIGNSAFANCYSLETIIIPKSVIFMGSNVFSECKDLTIYCEADSLPNNWDSNWNIDNRPVVWGYTTK